VSSLNRGLGSTEEASPRGGFSPRGVLLTEEVSLPEGVLLTEGVYLPERVSLTENIL
jgi:hypothetical protein